jgi:hypothetical protein
MQSFVSSCLVISRLLVCSSFQSLYYYQSLIKAKSNIILFYVSVNC